MAVTAEELEIVVKGNVQDAMDKLEKLRAKMSGQLSKAANSIKPSMQQAAKAASNFASTTATKMSILNREIEIQQKKVKQLAGEYYKSLKSGKNSKELLSQYQKASIQLDKLKLRAQEASKNVGELGDKAKTKATPAIAKLAARFKTLIVLMAIRKVIQAAIKGFQDLAKYSTGFNSSMSQMQSAFLQARNSIASAFAPVLRGLTPIIVSVTNAIINLFNWLAKVNTVLFTNKKTFTQAKAVTTDYAKSLGKAKDEAKGALASFDELNVISEPAQTDNGMPDASQMFEEQTIDEETSNRFAGLKAVFEGIYDIGSKLWNYVLKPIASWTGGAIVTVFTKVGDAVAKLFKFLNGETSFKEFLNDLSFGETLLLAFLAALALVGTAILAYNAAMAIASAATAIFGGIMTLLTSPITWVVLAITALIVIIVELIKHWDEVKAWGIECWEKIKETWNAAGDWFNEKVVIPIATFFGNMWQGIKAGAGTLADWIKQKVINPTVNAFKILYNSVIDKVENMVNGIIGLINAFIKGINRMLSGLNELLATAGLHINPIQLIETVSIPRLAQGGVLSKATIFEGGEYAGASQNPEIVTPQDLMYETNIKANIPVMNAIEDMADKVVGAIKNLGVYAEFDYSKLKVGLDAENRRVGSKLYGGAY